MFFDSCPGRARFSQAHRAVTTGMNPLVKFLFTIFFAPSYFLLTLLGMLLGRKDQIERLRAAMARADVLPPWTDKATPRVYMYSAKDELVNAEDVEDHVADLRALGINARLEKFEGSAHVAHMRTEPERYWGIVRETWEKECENAAQR